MQNAEKIMIEIFNKASDKNLTDDDILELKQNPGWELTIACMKAYAEQAITEDRKIVAKYAEAYLKDSLTAYQKYTANVDANSILSAPRLILI